MKKAQAHRTSVKRSPPPQLPPPKPALALIPTGDPRQTLRDFYMQVVDAEDPITLARLVDVEKIAGVLKAVAKIETWFKRYADELNKWRVQ